MKTKALISISFAVTAKLICVFVFAYAKYWFSQDEAHCLQTHQLLFKTQGKLTSSILEVSFGEKSLESTVMFLEASMVKLLTLSTSLLNETEVPSPLSI